MNRRTPRTYALVGIALGLTGLVACSSGSASPSASGSSAPSESASASASPSPTASPTPTPKPTPTLPPVRGVAGSWVTVVAHKGRPEVQTQTLTAEGSSVTVMRMDGPTTRLILHAGYQDPGGEWLAGPAISPNERPTLVAAFNGGFNLGLGVGGFQVNGRNVGAIQPGLASVVTYTDGSSGLGAWGKDVPDGRKKVYSIRQNLTLLVDAGAPAADIDAYGPWGATLGGGFAVARSGLGIDRYGNLMWAGSSYATPRAIATALIQSGAYRAMQLDINPQWVGGFAFPNTTTEQVVLPSQSRPIGTFTTPYSRDFFAVTLRPGLASR
jgi:hypothetical protein